MSFVLDASIAACWAFSDEDHPKAEAAFTRIRKDEALVPTLWWFEVRNILLVNERRKRITASDTDAFLRNLGRLAMRIDSTPDESAVLRLSRIHRLSVYDAAYLELAQRETVMLATLDTDLQKAARVEGIPLIQGN
jgi:predicted nucleic acid-binding protein